MSADMDFDVIPAIDLRGGRCVRLTQGDYAREMVFSDDPEAVAEAWAGAGARTIHVVDLDGAAEGRPANLEALRAIRSATAATIQFGGGLRGDESVREALDAGADRVVLGTALVKNPDWVEQLCAALPDRVVVGIDARDGRVATEGWRVPSALAIPEVVERANQLGVRRGLFTDIERDGTLEGPNLEALRRVVEKAQFAVMASGGIATLDDIDEVRRTGAAAVIVGRALYTGQVDLAVALRRIAETPSPSTRGRGKG